MITGIKMKGFLSVLAAVVVLSGCDGKDNTHEGYYLFDQINVEFDNSKTKPQDNLLFRPVQQQQIAQQIKQQNSEIYFNFTSSTVEYYTPFNHQREDIINERVQLNGVSYTITQEKGHTLRLLSDKATNCGFYSCQITITLKKTSTDSPEFIKRQQQQQQRENDYQTQMRQNINYFQQPVLDDFLGIPLSLGNDFAIKMPLDMRLVDRTPTDCTRNCNLNSLPLASQDSGEMSIFTYYSRQEKHGGTLYIFNGKSSEITITEQLVKQTKVLFQTENGAIYYNTQGELEAFYFRYDTASGRYLVGVAQAATAEQIAREFTILRTMDPHYREQNIISMDDLQLSRQALEEKYQAKVSDVFDATSVQKAIWQTMELMLTKPKRFYDSDGMMMLAPVWFPSQKSHADIYVQIYANSIDSLMEGEEIGLVARDKPKGKRAGNFLIFEGQNFARYYYMIKIDEQLTLVLGAPESGGNEREKMFLSQVFKQLDLATSPLATVPAEERKNLFKYKSSSSQIDVRSDERHFTVDEGLLDNHGNLIIPQPKNGYFSIFTEQPPFILASLRNKDHQDVCWSIFNEQGKKILDTDSYTEIIEQYLVIARKSKKEGIFDLASQQWLLLPTYQNIYWMKSAFIATDEEDRKYLIDKKGNVLISDAKYLYNTERKNHFVVVNRDGTVSLVNEQGKAWFHHRGNALRYIEEIDAWLIIVPDEEGEKVGVIGEHGEILIPVEYDDYKITGNYLQMLRKESSTFFTLAQIKDWKNHLPLQGVPAP